MHNKHQHPIEFLLKELFLPIGLTGFFFFYTVFNSRPITTQGEAAIWFIQWILAVALAPILLVLELFGIFGRIDTGLGSTTWTLKLYSYWLYAILLVILLFQWFG